jgi:hypothetical protein
MTHVASTAQASRLTLVIVLDLIVAAFDGMVLLLARE